MVPHDVLHAISDGDGWIHRAVNILGCALMLGGNWWSKRTAGENGAEGGGGGVGVGGGACFVPGCGRIECEVDGEGMAFLLNRDTVRLSSTFGLDALSSALNCAVCWASCPLTP